MADYVAVLKKTIDGLGDTTPQVRQKIYEKARSTIEKKLKALDPPPSDKLIDQQMNALEDAIDEVEKEYSAEKPKLAKKPEPDKKPEPVVPPPAVKPKTREADDAPDEPPETVNDEPAESPAESMVKAERWSDPSVAPRPTPRPANKNRSMVGLLWGVLLLLLIGAGAYFAWANQQSVMQYVESARAYLFATDGTDTEMEQDTADEENDRNDNASVDDNSERPGRSTNKFTQRLTEDGREIDEGPADSGATLGEGRSEFNSTPRKPTDLAQAIENPGDSNPPATEQPAVAVGQKAFLYEERSGTQAEVKQAGTVVWSTVQESPGGDEPAEPAIRGDIAIPDQGLSLRITFRRNADKTLPASHIIELVFITTDAFEGGVIDRVDQISMKDAEETPGNPLIGIPTKIADGFFLVALTDARAEVETNTTLLRRQSWIDIPIAYGSGRRALLTMEKGVPGDKIFDDVLTAWQSASTASPPAPQ